MEDKKRLFDAIRKAAEEGYVVLPAADAPVKQDIETFLSQGADGALYDINRDYATAFALYKGGLIATERFVNDMAVATIIKHLIKENEKLKKQIQ